VGSDWNYSAGGSFLQDRFGLEISIKKRANLAIIL